VFCVLLWMIDEYWMYSAMTLVMLVILETTMVKQRIANAAHLAKMRSKPVPVNVYREVCAAGAVRGCCRLVAGPAPPPCASAVGPSPPGWCLSRDPVSRTPPQHLP
jgi:hypothetical protein